MTHIAKINSVIIKWSEYNTSNKLVIKTKQYKTQKGLDKFRARLEVQSNLYKIIGESRDVEYVNGWDTYAESFKKELQYETI